MTATRFGDWATARTTLERLGSRAEGGMRKALLKEAQLFRKEIVEGIAAQAPGGEAFAPLSALTLALRKLRGFRGSKALARHGDLRNSVQVTETPEGAFVGVLRTARAEDGQPLVDLAELNESGSRHPIVVRVTDKLRALFLALYLEGLTAAPLSATTQVLVVRLPPRPFLAPVWKKLRPGAKERFEQNLARELGLGGGG
jgi:hypothetical protein